MTIACVAGPETSATWISPGSVCDGTRSSSREPEFVSTQLRVREREDGRGSTTRVAPLVAVHDSIAPPLARSPSAGGRTLVVGRRPQASAPRTTEAAACRGTAHERLVGACTTTGPTPPCPYTDM